MIVLGYIANTKKRLTFVANRISAIHESSTPNQWRHVPGKENPADLASRGIRATDAQRLRFWLTGPKFLWENESKWPNTNDSVELDEKDIEIRKDCIVYATNKEESILESMFDRYFRFSQIVTSCSLAASFQIILSPSIPTSKWISQH